MPYQSKSLLGKNFDNEFEEDLDNLIHIDGCYPKIYAVPRISKCISSGFLKIINLFGNSRGFDIILDIFKK